MGWQTGKKWPEVDPYTEIGPDEGYTQQDGEEG